MLTGIVMSALYGADICFVAFLIFGVKIKDLFAVVMFGTLFHILVAIFITRALIRFFPVSHGKFSVRSPNYDRWRAQGVIAIVSSVLFDQFLPIFMRAGWYRLFGAKLDRDVTIGGRIIDPPFVRMKQGSGLGAEGMILGHHIAKDHIVVGTVTVGCNAMIGARALVMPNVEIGDGAAIGAYAVVTSGKRIGPGETWVGVPARPLKSKSSDLI